jgi:hypothetical protein
MGVMQRDGRVGGGRVARATWGPASRAGWIDSVLHPPSRRFSTPRDWPLPRLTHALGRAASSISRAGGRVGGRRRGLAAPQAPPAARATPAQLRRPAAGASAGALAGWAASPPTSTPPYTVRPCMRSLVCSTALNESAATTAARWHHEQVVNARPPTSAPARCCGLCLGRIASGRLKAPSRPRLSAQPPLPPPPAAYLWPPGHRHRHTTGCCCLALLLGTNSRRLADSCDRSSQASSSADWTIAQAQAAGHQSTSPAACALQGCCWERAWGEGGRRAEEGAGGVGNSLLALGLTLRNVAGESLILLYVPH